MFKQPATFQYRSRDPNAMRKRSEQWNNERDSFLKDHVPLWRPSDGANIIRILPPTWPDAEHYGLDIYVHYGVGPDNSAYLDLTKMKKQPDPITEEVAEARTRGEEDYAKKMDSKKRVLVYLIDRDKPKDGIMMWAMPWTVDKEIAIQCFDQRTKESLPIDSPDEGYDITITRSGSKDRTEYSIKIDRHPSAVKMTDEMLDILEQNPLPDCLIFHTYEHIKEAFRGSKPLPPVSGEPTDRGAKPEAYGKERSRGETHKPKPAQRAEPEFDVEALTYDAVRGLAGQQLDRLIQQLLESGYDGLDMLEDADQPSDEELMDAICKVLRLRPPAPARRLPPGKHVQPEDEDVEFEPPAKAPAPRRGREEDEPARRPALVDDEEEPVQRPAASDIKSRLAGLRNRTAK